MFIPLLVLGIIFLLIAVRQIGSVRLQIWQIMLGGAVVLLALQQISLQEAFYAIDFDVLLFLFGMFIVGEALERSGYLAHLSYHLFKRATCTDHLILFILFSAGIASALLMNDTLAIIGTPVVLLLAKKHQLPPQIFLLALAFGITIGSVFSPIGNPQNLLIALHMQQPFTTFFTHLLIPTILNLFLGYMLLKRFYRMHFHHHISDHSQEPIKDHQLAQLCKISLILIFLLILARTTIIDFRLTYIALLGAFPMVFHPQRFSIIKRIDWETLVFFAAMFVVMKCVWNTGFFQQFVQSFSVPSLLLGSIFISQFLSNVPLVALFLPLISGEKELISLAAGSTIAGNLFILGAASNVIIIQNAEKKASQTITFWEFARIGIPLTIINALVYWVFL